MELSKKTAIYVVKLHTNNTHTKFQHLRGLHSARWGRVHQPAPEVRQQLWCEGLVSVYGAAPPGGSTSSAGTRAQPMEIAATTILGRGGHEDEAKLPVTLGWLPPPAILASRTSPEACSPQHRPAGSVLVSAAPRSGWSRRRLSAGRARHI